MQLTSQSKPIRIRVKSGGEEHSTLESLLNKFDVKDLLPLLDGRLSRWLKQQGETALATKVDDFVAKQATVLEALKNKAANDSDKYDVYYGISSLFFKDDFKKLKLNNINDLFEVWLSGSERPVRLDILIKNLFRDFNDVNRFLNETSYSGKVLSDKIIELNNAEMMYNVAAEVLKGKLSCLTKQEAEDLIFLANDKEESRAKLWVERTLKRDSDIFVLREKIRLCNEWLNGKSPNPFDDYSGKMIGELGFFIRIMKEVTHKSSWYVDDVRSAGSWLHELYGKDCRLEGEWGRQGGYEISDEIKRYVSEDLEPELKRIENTKVSLPE